MDDLNELREILTDIMDIEGETITEETCLIRDLGAESIDLLELVVAMNHRFRIEVKQEEVLLSHFRLYRMEAERTGQPPLPYLAERFPFLPEGRIEARLVNRSLGPTLTVADLAHYIRYQRQGAPS